MKKSNADLVLEAVQDLHAQEQIVTRETLQEITGLKLSVIDDRVGYLVDEGLVHRVQRGVFVPAPDHHPARCISKMILPDGTVKIDIGDDHVLTLTPREARTLGGLMIGSGMQFAAIEVGHQAAIVASELAQQVKQLRREVNLIGSGANLPEAAQSSTHASTDGDTQPSTEARSRVQHKRNARAAKAAAQQRWREKKAAASVGKKTLKKPSTKTTTQAPTQASTKLSDKALFSDSE